jgi:small-conductance mechanosensitive channel
MNILDTERHASAPKIRRFLKHLGEASEKSRMMRKIEQRKDFVQKINTFSSQEPSMAHEDLIRADAKTIETQIKKALNIERQLFERQKHDETELFSTKQAISNEEKEINSLRESIGNFQQKVSSVQRSDEQVIRNNSERIDKITDMISKLSQKLDELSRLKQNTEVRAKEIETRIMEQPRTFEPAMPVRQPSVFLVKKKDIPAPKINPVVHKEESEEGEEDKVSKSDLKKKLRFLERHYEKMDRAGFHSKQDMDKLGRKIDSIKKKMK